MSGEHIHTLKNFETPDESGILGNKTKMRSSGMAARFSTGESVVRIRQVFQNSSKCGCAHPTYHHQASDVAVLYGNDAFSVLVLSTKIQYSSYLKKGFIIQKFYSKVKVLETFKISTDCHIKTCRSLKQRAILKTPSAVFRIIYALSVGFKMKPLRKSFFQCYDKNQPKFSRKTC